MRLYLDIDGVILGKKHPADIDLALAEGCLSFLDFALANFDCLWLTTHCQGKIDTVLNYLEPYSTELEMQRFAQIQPTFFQIMKTEALTGDFIWIDDSPMASELDYLEKFNLLNRWFQIDTRQNRRDLVELIPILKRVLSEGF